jgi:hypothetical protein
MNISLSNVKNNDVYEGSSESLDVNEAITRAVELALGSQGPGVDVIQWSLLRVSGLRGGIANVQKVSVLIQVIK